MEAGGAGLPPHVTNTWHEAFHNFKQPLDAPPALPYRPFFHMRNYVLVSEAEPFLKREEQEEQGAGQA